MMLPIKESFPLWACNLMQIRVSDCQMSETMMPWTGCSWLRSQYSVVVCLCVTQIPEKDPVKMISLYIDLTSFACNLPRNIVCCSNDVTFAKEAFKPWCLAFIHHHQWMSLKPVPVEICAQRKLLQWGAWHKDNTISLMSIYSATTCLPSPFHTASSHSLF